MSGAESWNDIADYGKAKQEWLKTFLTLPSGIPSHDTFNRVFAALDPEEMEKGFAAWLSSIAILTAGEAVAIDGKALCGSRESGNKTLVHMVSAWAEGNGLVLAQRKIDEKSNEITAIPKLLEVTIDAMAAFSSEIVWQREKGTLLSAMAADCHGSAIILQTTESDLRSECCLFLNHREQPISRFGLRYILARCLGLACEDVPDLRKK